MGVFKRNLCYVVDTSTSHRVHGSPVVIGSSLRAIAVARVRSLFFIHKSKLINRLCDIRQITKRWSFRLFPTEERCPSSPITGGNFERCPSILLTTTIWSARRCVILGLDDGYSIPFRHPLHPHRLVIAVLPLDLHSEHNVSRYHDRQ